MVTIKAKDAFGEYDPGLTSTIDLENAPLEMRYVGAEVTAENRAGESKKSRATKI